MQTSPIVFYKPDNIGGFQKAPTSSVQILHPNAVPLSELMVYLKTTETCQLNCDHCFTNGTNGKKGFFNVPKTIDWFHRLHKVAPTLTQGNVAFHGGEPFLAPVSDMREVWSSCKDLWPNLWWSTTTNLVYKLDNEKLDFMKEAFTAGLATSWDKDIRFSNKKQEDLWADNVRTLVQEGFDVTLMVII